MQIKSQYNKNPQDRMEALRICRYSAEGFKLKLPVL